MVISYRSKSHDLWTGWFKALTFSLALIAPTFVMAQDNFFLPNSLAQGDNQQQLNFSSLNNAQLIERAKDLRSQDLNATQRALNHQWLQNYQDQNFVEGSKVYRTILKRSLKKFWNRQRKERFKSERVPDINGRGTISREMDYDLRFTSDELKLKLIYEF